MLTPRENLLCLWRRRNAEYAPVQFNLSPAQKKHFAAIYGSGIDYQDYFNIPWRSIPDKLTVQTFADWRNCYYHNVELKPDTAFDWWGVAREPDNNSHFERMYYPLENIEDLEFIKSYPFPAIDNRNIEATAELVCQIQARGFAAAGWLGFTVWESVWFLRGLENTMMGMMCDDEITNFLFETVRNYAVKRAEALALAGADLLMLAEDVGMQDAEMMSPETYRRYLKPGLSAVVRAAKKVNPDIIITYHSCGHINRLLPDIIECGIDVLNPLQSEAGMDFETIYREYGDAISYWGGLGTQRIIPFGSEEEIRCRTLKYLDLAGANGGLLCAPTHVIEPEVPWKNLMAYVNACKEFSGKGKFYGTRVL